MSRIQQSWAGWSLLTLLLLPLSGLLCLLVWFRRKLYRLGLLKSGRLAVPVVVVGNISVGGTGKTPVVVWLAQWLRKQGWHPGIITRGYGGQSQSWPRRVEPDTPSKGIVLLAHGWGRNRDRMVNRARMFGSMGYTTVIHSARDHGQSTSCRFMNAMKFCEDIEAVLNWVGEPVILYGHSAGAGGAIIAAERNPGKMSGYACRSPGDGNCQDATLIPHNY